MSLKLLTWNIQACIGTSGYRDYLFRAHRQVMHTRAKITILHHIARAIADYDVVCLQEVDLGGRRAGFRCQANDIAVLSGHKHVILQENRTVRGLSRHGNAILSRSPVRDVQDFKLPGRLSGRGCLIAQIDCPVAVTVASLHLSLGVADQTRQLSFVADALPGRGHWAVMGDFNCRANSAPIAAFCDRLNIPAPRIGPATYPSWKPRWDYDHILSDASSTLTHYGGLALTHSDHLPVIGTLNF